MQPHTTVPVLEKGDALPFFEVATVTGERVRYADLSQRKNVVLVCLPELTSAEDERYIRELSDSANAFETYAAACVVTRERVKQVPSPGLVIADRWGEVQYLASSPSTSGLPDVREILDTLDFVQRRCPECEGEWK
jgi:hypothetical protein